MGTRRFRSTRARGRVKPVPPKRTKPENVEASEKEHLHLHMDKTIAERLRVAAAKQRMKLSAMAETLIEEALDARETSSRK